MDNITDVHLGKNELIDAASKILFMLAEKYPKATDKTYNELVVSYTKNLLNIIDKQYPIKKIYDGRINVVINYIHKNIDKIITLEELAKLYCLEKNYFIRLFKENMSVSPYKYIKNYRLKLAASYLKRDCTVSEAAELVEYSDVSSFSHAFEKEYGKYPSEYKKISRL